MVRVRPSRTGSRGQTLTELAFLSPVLLLFLLGVGDTGYALYQTHRATAFSREGANLIARYETFDDTSALLQAVATAPLDVDADRAVILSVLKLGTGGSNKNQAIVTQRLRFGSLGTASVLGDPASAAFGNDANHKALDPDDDARLRAPLPLPNGLTLVAGQSVYVVEVYHRRRSIGRAGLFGWVLPSTVSASAFF